jgi:hypothetical protein
MQIDAAFNDANDDANDSSNDATPLSREQTPRHVMEPVKLVKKREPMVRPFAIFAFADSTSALVGARDIRAPSFTLAFCSKTQKCTSIVGHAGCGGATERTQTAVLKCEGPRLVRFFDPVPIEVACHSFEELFRTR